MFNYSKRKEERRLKEEALLKEMKLEGKPKFKDLALLVLRQQLLILPVVILFMVILMLVGKLILVFWGA
jgi:hypothetical protein